MNPYVKMNYASFYVSGLKEIFGKSAIFDFNEFEDFPFSKSCFSFIIENDSTRKKIAIDFGDLRKPDSFFLEWGDLYAKINLHEETFSEISQIFGSSAGIQTSKIINITPGFGVRVFSLIETAILSFKILLRKKHQSIQIIKDLLRAYFKRLPLDAYQPSASDSDYIFYMETLWHKTTSYINLQRAAFIRAVQRLENVNFEGGLVDVGYDCDYIPDLKDLKYNNKKIALRKFITKTKKSALVFNNPAGGHCHGWKLAEFWAMGKAIISKPLENQISPEPQDRMNVYFANHDEESLKIAAQKIIIDDEFRKQLEFGAHKYWQDYAKPSKVIERILEAVEGLKY